MNRYEILGLDENGQPPRKKNAARVCDRTVDELVGLAKGMVADGVVNHQEAEVLVRWVQANYDLAPEDFVMRHLHRRVNAMLADGVIDASERQELFEILCEVCGHNPAPECSHSLSTSLPLDNPPPDVVIPYSYFCLTGKFAMGTRPKCEEVLEELNGYPQANVTLDTNYLIVGMMGSRDWIHSSYGRKIEKAVEFNRTRGMNISIITEEHWADALFAASQGL